MQVVYGTAGNSPKVVRFPCSAVSLKNGINTETRGSATQRDIVICAECEGHRVMGRLYLVHTSRNYCASDADLGWKTLGELHFDLFQSNQKLKPDFISFSKNCKN